MKEPSSIKSASIAARPSPLGSHHPSTRVSRSGPQFFPENTLENEGDSDMNAKTTQPPAMPPISPPQPPSTPPTPPNLSTTHEPSTHNSVTTPETSPILDASKSIHAPETNKDSQMEISPPLSPHSPPTEPPARLTSLGTLVIEEINLHAHIAMAEQNCSIIKSSALNATILLPQFTPIPNRNFPSIHLAHAAQLFDYQAPKVITAWLKIGESLNQDLQDVKISPPCPEAGKEGKGYPLSFLAYNITDEAKSLLLSQCIWSSPDISFAASAFTIDRVPTLLIYLQGFSTMDPDTVKQAVYDTWSEDIVRFDLGEILSKSEIPENAIQYHIWQFINSITIKHLDFKISGGLPLPHYNVFANSPMSNPETWKNLHKYIHSFSYPSDLDGCGTTVYFIPCTVSLNRAPAGPMPLPRYSILEWPQACENPHHYPPERKRERTRKAHTLLSHTHI
ncbi:uncharacterized protein BJ212DRAFT_1299507 [Suillus subaureus]|uniref:Uncharacterized protein n=1 Tax=Suillus subaureus TaxID=48587 RepID=A0A9P7JDR8_9AGAM|nr:uncharacterized protein BJ212DRAFT_1299507 [Suillus subaureus]KAG1816753.1 hypothetical protein BJ212DRAFT_1299507 [Suillus subaureus]